MAQLNFDIPFFLMVKQLPSQIGNHQHFIKKHHPKSSKRIFMGTWRDLEGIIK